MTDLHSIQTPMTSCTPASLISRRSLDVDALNQRFETAHPMEILSWCLVNIPQGLVQSTAFGIDGIIIMDWLYRHLAIDRRVPVLFLDTLHHFPETLDLVERLQHRYSLDLRVYQPQCVSTREAFAARYGAALWERDIEGFYALTKVEPLQRALKELGAIAWITGRRRDQASSRTTLPIFEWDAEHRLKVNPLATWTHKQVWTHIMANHLPYNPLHDQGYASIGDEPTTTPVQAGEHERAGRWRGSDKMECGIHL